VSAPSLDCQSLTALVDSDIIAFRACFAGEYKVRDVFSPKDLDEPIITFRYVKDMKAWFKKYNKDEADFVIETRVVLEPLNQVLHTAKMMMKSIEDKFTGGKPIGFLSGKNNFRENTCTEVPYKGSRWTPERRAKEAGGRWDTWLKETEAKYKPIHRPTYEKQVKEYLIKYWNTIFVEGQEADDALGIAQTEATKGLGESLPHSTIIVSVDKDLKMITGWHQDVTAMDCDPEFVDPITANRNFYAQLIKGDRTDTIPGIHGMGDVKAAKVVAELDTIEEMWSAVREVYTNKVPDITEETIVQRGNLLWIRREEGVLWKIPTQ